MLEQPSPSNEHVRTARCFRYNKPVMEIKKLEVGSLSTNCYLIYSKGETGIIDPGGDPGKILKNLNFREPNGNRDHGKLEPKVKWIVATHFHWDHVNALPKLVKELKADFFISKNDHDLYQKDNNSYIEPKKLLTENCSIKLGSANLQVWETSGHSPGSITLAELDEKKLFVGDLIFAGGFGRTDLPGGSAKDLRQSLARLVKLEGNWTIFPGHGPTTDLQAELDHSPLLQDLVRNG